MDDMENIIETGRRIAESYNRNGEGFDNTGRKNAYECEDCQAYIVTVDRHPGVTPFLTKCGACGGMAQSKMYRVADRLSPTHEWYRPENLEDVPRGSEDHIAKGGLVLRAIDGARWQTGEPVKSRPDVQREFDAMKAMMKQAEKLEKAETLTRQQIRHAERKHRDAPAEITMYGHRYQRID